MYEWDLGKRRDAMGLRFLHKVTEEHVRLTPQARMRVYLAAQVNLNLRMRNSLILL